ncbi:MAG TPA: GNAT family N-acetyltransferase [Anaerolineales bacterium]|nr:GNAT family N-acetyltransferase [Anaerolineales bacterium]
MDVELIPLSHLTETDVKRLAVLHHSVMHTLLSDLGLPIVLRYYQIARGDASVLGICALNSSNEVLGWAIGSPHPDKINSRLRTPFVWFLMQLFRLVFARPFVLWQLVSSVVSSSTEIEMKRDSIELTYIGVALNHRSIGLGKDLLNAFIEKCREKGYQSIFLSVETDNKPAIALYEKLGFKIIKTYSEGRYQRRRMELILE